VIYIKAGTYSEQVNVGKNAKNLMIYGDGIGQTILTGSKSVTGGSTTFLSATLGKKKTHSTQISPVRNFQATLFSLLLSLSSLCVFEMGV
jgi:pectin methylesterase-like acyl-CoA thioesterase